MISAPGAFTEPPEVCDLGVFTVGPEGIAVADQVYNVLRRGLSVIVPEALPGRWSASVSPPEEGARAPSRALIAMHTGVLAPSDKHPGDEQAGDEQAGDEQAAVWEVLEWHLCCDSCDVAISDAALRRSGTPLQRLGSGDGLIPSAATGETTGEAAGETVAAGAKAVCCFNPWRCEVSVRRGVAGGQQGVIGVRVRWFSATCEIIHREFHSGGVLHWARLEDGVINVLSEQGREVERSFDDLYWGDLDEAMDDLGLPAALREELYPILIRHGVPAAAPITR
jgi:hypothetical protein